MNQKNMPFSAKADAYAKGRPGYPDAALSFLKQKGSVPARALPISARERVCFQKRC
ncbi:MAG: hypothetical protein ACI4TE_07975 [Alphaproteobacteria bacterium]